MLSSIASKQYQKSTILSAVDYMDDGTPLKLQVSINKDTVGLQPHSMLASCHGYTLTWLLYCDTSLPGTSTAAIVNFKRGSSPESE